MNLSFSEPTDTDTPRQEPQRELYLLESVGSLSYLSVFDVKGKKVSNERTIAPEELIAKLSCTDSDTWIDSRILVSTPQKLVWHYTPEPDQNLYYKHGSNKIISPIKWCSFVFKRVGKNLSVVALQHKTRPKLTTRVYHAPLGNVYASSAICLGTAQLPDTNDIDEISKTYFESVKTHINNTNFLRGKDKLTNQDYFDWISEKRTKPIRVSELEPFGTVKDFIRR